MEAHQLALLRVEPPRLVQQARGHAQLAHVVHERRQLHLHDVGSAELQSDRNLPRRCGHLERVPVGGAVGLRKRLDQRAYLRLGVAKAELVAGMVAQQAPDHSGHLVEQVALACARACVRRPPHPGRATRAPRIPTSTGAEATLPSPCDPADIGTRRPIRSGSVPAPATAANRPLGPGGLTRIQALSNPSTVRACSARRSSTIPA